MDRGIARVSRVAECRADGSWYGRSSGPASAVPRRPPGASLNSHPNTLHRFSQEPHEVITHTLIYKRNIRRDFFSLQIKTSEDSNVWQMYSRQAIYNMIQFPRSSHLPLNYFNPDLAVVLSPISAQPSRGRSSWGCRAEGYRQDGCLKM